MKAKATMPLLAAAVIVGMLLPAAGAADGGAKGRAGLERLRAEISQELVLKGTRGFDIGVRVRNRSLLKLVAVKGSAGVTYELPIHEPQGSDEIKADLGKLGRIDVRFVPKKIRKEKQKLLGCHGKKEVIEEGHFVGHIDFYGEDGYTRVRATKARGAVTIAPEVLCKPLPSESPKKQRKENEAAEKAVEKLDEEAEVETLGVVVKATGREQVTFSAGRFSARVPDKKAFNLIIFSASAHRSRGRIDERSEAVELLSSAKTFRVPDRRHPTQEVVIEPPSPFSGTGTFRREPDGSASWTGDLRLELPGFGDVRLSGPGTKAVICADPGCHLGHS